MLARDYLPQQLLVFRYTGNTGITGMQRSLLPLQLPLAHASSVVHGSSSSQTMPSGLS